VEHGELGGGCRLLVVKSGRNDPLEDLFVDGNIILKQISKF
jgi:hypothetical protein